MRKQRERTRTKARCEAKASKREAARAAGRIEGDDRLVGRRPKCICEDPKDGELRSGRPKPDESLVEGRSDSDVQIDRPT